MLEIQGLILSAELQVDKIHVSGEVQKVLTGEHVDNDGMELTIISLIRNRLYNH